MLFQSQDLAAYLREPVDIATAVMAERVAWGWLRPVLGLEARPDPVPDELFSWALELAAIAHSNPSGLASYQLGEERLSYSAERRAEILLAAGGSTVATPAAQGAPMGLFPDAVAWPDPPRVCWGP